MRNPTQRSIGNLATAGLALLACVRVACYAAADETSGHAAAPSSSGPVVLVKDGAPQATIILANQPTETAQRAAVILRDTVRQMSGAELGIAREVEWRNEGNAILVGPSELAAAKGIDVNQEFEEGDHYLIRTGPGYVALVGNDAVRPFGMSGGNGHGLRGSVFAVYDLLDRLGCGWYRPDPAWHVIPKQKTVYVPALDLDERPAFVQRDLRIMHRHRMLQDAWRLTGRWIQTHHILSALLPPEKLGKDHPDWFGPKQPCMTHPGAIGAIADRFRELLDEHPGWTREFSITANDCGGFCECDTCRAVGNISARQLHFANAIARELATTHPNRFRLGSLAYWFSHDPPDPVIRAEPGVHFLIVNEGDHTKPLDAPERPEVARQGRSNTREVTAFEGWRKTGALTGVYEWWIPGANNEVWRSVPWYSGETALRNLRYWQRGGIKYLNYETNPGWEGNGGFPLRWPLFYVGARGMWDAELTAEQIMGEACRKLYGPAAGHMQAYYGTLEKAMAETLEFGQNWHLPSPETIYTPRIEHEASGHLAAAEDAVDDPAILARIVEERRAWNNARKIMSRLRRPFQVVLDDRTLDWSDPQIDGRAIRDIFSLKPAAPLFVVREDGKLPVEDKQMFDLGEEITFATSEAGEISAKD